MKIRGGRSRERPKRGLEGSNEVLNGARIFVSLKFEFVVVRTVELKFEMSLNGSSQNDPKVTGEALSKRDQMKLERTIKTIQAQDNQQTRTHKRRAHTHLHAHESSARKQIKIDAHYRPHPSDDIISSPSVSNEPASTTPAEQRAPAQHLPKHLNPSYSLPQGEGTLFNYLLGYSYKQGEKQMQNEKKDWSVLDKLGSDGLMLGKCSASLAMCNKLQKKFVEMKDRIREPFGRGHREFGKKFLKKQFMLE